MIEEPTTRPEGSTTLIFDHRTATSGQRLRFWGAFLIGATALMTVAVPRWRSFDEPIDLIVPLVTVAVGSILILLGGRPTRLEVPLARLMPQDGLMRVYASASEVLEGQDRDIWMDEIREVLFGLTRFPLNPARPEITVEAFTVCLLLYDGSIVPVVEATGDKLVAFNLANAMGESLGVPMSQTGLGV